MQSIEVHRAVIGKFYARIASSRVQSNIKVTYGMFSNDYMTFLCRMMKTFFHNFIMVIFIFANLHIAAFNFTRLVAEGIESNPGPDTALANLSAFVKKHVLASFHQGHMKFGYSAGIQCMSNAFFAICFAVVKKVSTWKHFDLDFILEQGDRLFKSTGMMQPLAVDELPLTFDLENCLVQSQMLHCHSALFSIINLFEHHNNLNADKLGNGAIFTCVGYSIALIWHKNSVYVFDSHSRNEYGEHVENGQAVLLEFRSLSVVNTFLKVILGKLSSETQYDIQYIEFNIPAASCDLINSALKRQRKNESLKRKYNAAIENEPGTCSSGEHIADRKKRYYQQNKSAILQQRKENYVQNKSLILEQRKESYSRSKSTILEERKESYSTNKSAILKERKEFYSKNKSAILEERKEFYSKKKSAILEKRKEYFLRNKEHIYEVNKQYQEANRDRILAKRKQLCKVRKDEMNQHRASKFYIDMVDRINRFKELAKMGPFHVCVICNRCLYARSVKPFDQNKYDNSQIDVSSLIFSISGISDHICKTCDSCLKRSTTPAQAVWNKLQLFQRPAPLRNLNTLERILISRRVLFKKVMIMPKGHFPKIQGAVCNVPIESSDITDVLPRGADSTGLVSIKLKRKLQFRGHVCFENVSPDSIFAALEYLREHNDLYQDVVVNTDEISDQLVNFTTADADIDDSETATLQRTTKPHDGGDDDLEINEDPLDQYRLNAPETLLIPKKAPEQISIAPGENKTPYSILTDEHCEELSFPCLFPTGKFGFKVERAIPLSAAKYFNQRLLNYTQQFATDSDYIFYALSLTQSIKLISQINIAMKKACSGNLTAGMLTSDFNQRVKNFINKNEAYQFMNQIPGTPAYWKKFLLEVLSMVKQLGLPTFFMTLSCADLRWNELIYIIAKLRGQTLTDEAIQNLDFFQRCSYLNLNPVLLARHFQYRLETFFRVIVLNGPLGKVIYHVMRIEFQVRGSPHVHSFLWVLNAPVLTKDNVQEYIDFVDNIVRASVPDKEQNSDLFALVTTYQVHSHSKSCRKYKSRPCRYNFGKFFCDRTVIAVPLPDDINKEEKSNILVRRDKILSKVKEYIDSNLNPRIPRKRNIFDPTAPDFEKLPSIPEILAELDINEFDYYNALSIASDSDFELHLKREPNACFVNNYFEEGLQAWEANIDIQPVFNYYKAVAYMCAYLSKAETKETEAMAKAAEEAYKAGKSDYEKMKDIARAYNRNRECSVQEAVYLIMPELWLRKTFPRVIFLNSNLPGNRCRILRKKEELDELPEDSTDLFQKNSLDRYLDRPDRNFQKGKYASVDDMCYAEFCAYYYVDPKLRNINDCQPVVLDEDVMSENHGSCCYPKAIRLMSSKNKWLRCRKVKAVIRYHVPNPNLHAEKYAHHLLFCFYPFRDEEQLKSPSTSGTYMAKLQESGVLDIINHNRNIMEPFCSLVDSAVSNTHASNVSGNCDAFAQQENDEVEAEMDDSLSNALDEDPTVDAVILDENQSIFPPNLNSPVLSTDDDINSSIRSLNAKQRMIFDIVHGWSKCYVKNLNSVTPVVIEPLHIFLTGGAGCGKSFLTRVLYQALSKTFSYRNSSLEKPKVLLIAPTGVAAINIQGTTIHTGLSIPVKNKIGVDLPELTAETKSKLRNTMSELKAVIIDEISMVSNLLLFYIHERLVEIFGRTDNAPFAGLTVLAVGDLYQLPPIGAKPVFFRNSNIWLNFLGLWRLFRMAELTEVMRQRGDNRLIDMLNNIRVGRVTPEDIELLKSRFVKTNDGDYPYDALHIFAENKPASDHNLAMLNRLPNLPFFIPAVDDIPKNVTASEINDLQKRNQSDTGGLAGLLSIKVDARVMITVNIDLLDRLVNGQLGTVRHILSDQQGHVIKIYLQLDDPKAGLTRMNADIYARQHSLVPIEKVDASIAIRKRKVDSSPVIRRTQFPLALAWGCTVHKVQGLSLSKIVVSFQLFTQKVFNYGQMYVALSRVTSINGLFLLGNFSEKAVRADPRVVQEYCTLRSEYNLARVGCLDVSQFSMIITLLNVRSLGKHAVDICADQRLLQSDVLCLTETQLLPSNEDICHLPGFTIDFNSSEDIFCSLACAFRDTTTLHYHRKCCSFSLLSFSKLLFRETPIKMLLLYRKRTHNLTSFYQTLQNLVEGYEFDIVLGDFNLNALELHPSLTQTFVNYTLLVTEPTHISGSLLDHCYINDNLLKMYNTTCYVVTVPFSDHDAVQIQLKPKF